MQVKYCISQSLSHGMKLIKRLFWCFIFFKPCSESWLWIRDTFLLDGGPCTTKKLATQKSLAVLAAPHLHLHKDWSWLKAFCIACSKSDLQSTKGTPSFSSHIEDLYKASLFKLTRCEDTALASEPKEIRRTLPPPTFRFLVWNRTHKISQKETCWGFHVVWKSENLPRTRSFLCRARNATYNK